MKFIRAQQDYDNPRSLASRLRAARGRKIVKLIEDIHAEKGVCRILDLGGREDYWRMFDRPMFERLNVHITLVNFEGLSEGDPLFSSVAADACDLSNWPDNSFDLVHSNSVVEHVGDWRRMQAFAREVRRLAPRYYVQTPYFWFPIEPHFSSPFFHWLPENIRAWKLTWRAIGFYPKAADMNEAMIGVQDARLLDKRQFRALFTDAAYPDERFGGLVKSLIAIRA